MKMKSFLMAAAAVAMMAYVPAGAQVPAPPPTAAPPAMPAKTTITGKRINRIIDMWLKKQPVYYAQISGGGYEEGKRMAATKADYITYEMEHGPLDFKELRDFMRALVDAGPTRTGHMSRSALPSSVAG